MREEQHPTSLAQRCDDIIAMIDAILGEPAGSHPSRASDFAVRVGETPLAA
jgi:hypothetical protein